MLKIEGERIYLRDYLSADLHHYHEWISNDALMQYVNFDKTQSLEESGIKLEEAVRESQNPGGRSRYFLAVLSKQTGEFMGNCGIIIKERHEDSGIGDMGYILLEKFWGKGYATEIANLLIGFGFHELRLHKISATCDERNKASERVMIKCGLEKEGVLKQYRYKNGNWYNQLVYSILRDELIRICHQ